MSKERALIHIAGPKGAGKTRFIEALLGGIDEIILCARGVLDNVLRAGKESSPKSHAELRRYREAGASEVALYCFPASERRRIDAFFDTKLMNNYSKAAIIEGDCPLQFVDLKAFVTRPLLLDEPLLRRTMSDPRKKRAEELKSLKALAENPEATIQLLGNNVRLQFLPMALKNPSIIEKFTKGLEANLTALRNAPLPEATGSWALAPGFEGIELAQLVVVNILEDAERPAAEQMLQDIARLRNDDDVFKNVIGWKGNKIPIMAVIANITDPKDAGLKKAVARVKRTVRHARE